MRGKFTFQEGYIYKIPAHFGGVPFYPWSVVYGDMTCLSMQFETDPEALLRIIPEDFELLQPLVNVQFANSREVDWMSGGEYRLVQLSAPVKYMGNSEGLVGEYVFIIWENKACPILGGREEDGMPKIFADIAMERHTGDHWFTSASYECNTFLKLDLDRKAELGANEIDEMNRNGKVNYFGWRVLPNLGKGGSAISHATLYPQEMTVSRAWAGEGSCTWTKLSPELHPLQSGYIATLSDLPVRRYTMAFMLKGVARLNVGDSRTLP